MIFKYYTFEIVPWGAILDIDCTSSSKKTGRVTTWSTSTSYQTEYGYLGKDMSYFMESKAEPMSMTYSCTSKNGDLVDIQTNLTCTSTKNSSGIITSFTIDNTNWFNTAYTTESILISKNVQDTKITLNYTPYNPTSSSYTKFYINNNQIYQKSYQNNNLYYFNPSNAPINSTIKATYTAIKEIEENNIIVEEYSNYLGKAYVNKKPEGSPISTYNNNTQANLNIYSGPVYDSTRQKYFYYYIVYNSNCSVGDKLKIKYKYTENIEENHTAQEVIETTLHQGTITQYTNLTIEDCLDSNGGFVLYERNGNTISLSTNIYDGKNITIRYKKEKPYIRLCCDNVKMETAFLSSGNGYSSDFRYLSKDDNYIYPKSGQTGGYAKFLRYVTINWRSQKTQQVYFGMSGQGGLAYCGIYGGSDESNYTRLAYTLNNDTTSLSITTPAVKNLSVPYYSVEYVCNMSGDNYWHWPSRSVKPSLVSPIRYYTSDGYIKELTSGEYSVSGFPIPAISSLGKWGNNSSFYYVGDSYYINPSDGIQLYTNWYDACRDFCDGCDGGCGQSSEHGFRTSGGWNVSPWGEVVSGYADPGSICQDYDTTYYVYANTNFPNAIQNSDYPGYYKVTSVGGISCWTNQGSAY